MEEMMTGTPSVPPSPPPYDDEIERARLLGDDPKAGHCSLSDPERAKHGTEENLKERSAGRGPLLWLLIAIAIVLVICLCSLGFWTILGYERLSLLSGLLPRERRVILVSIDGFRFDYIYRGFTPTLAKLADEGIMGPMLSQFPSYTFPNHFSLVTGLYPVHHGIVSNAFYDPTSMDFFLYTDSRINDPKWWQAEPIWNTAERQGVKSGVLFWPGSEVYIKGRRPSYVLPYDKKMTKEQRIGQILSWIDQRDSPPLLAMYISCVDTAGHYFGPDSPELNHSLVEADKAIKTLLSGLRRRGLEDSVDLVIVSDHGMANQPREQFIYLDDFISKYQERITWADYGSVASILPKDTELETLHKELINAASSYSLPMRVYLKQEIPEKYHFRDSDRIPPLLIEAEIGWSISARSNSWHPKGQHGYDPQHHDMLSLLIAKGPHIRKNTRSFNIKQRMFPAVQNLDLYPFLAKLLDIEPLPNNGTAVLSKYVLDWEAIGLAE